MTKVTNVREQHCDAVFVRCIDGLVVTYASTRLHDERHSSSSKRIGAVTKRKESVARRNRTLGALPSTRARKPHRVNTILLTGTDAYRCAEIGRAHV